MIKRLFSMHTINFIKRMFIITIGILLLFVLCSRKLSENEKKFIDRFTSSNEIKRLPYADYEWRRNQLIIRNGNNNQYKQIVIYSVKIDNSIDSIYWNTTEKIKNGEQILFNNAEFERFKDDITFFWNLSKEYQLVSVKQYLKSVIFTFPESRNIVFSQSGQFPDQVFRDSQKIQISNLFCIYIPILK